MESLSSGAKNGRCGGVVSGRRCWVHDGNDRFTLVRNVFVKGVVAALEAGARGSAGARRRPSATGMVSQKVTSTT